MEKPRNRQFCETLPTAPATLLAASLLVFTQFATAATIGGHVCHQDTREPLVKVPVCLAPSSDPTDCTRLRWTDKKGNYAFSGLKAGKDYVVTVNGDTSAANRKYESYANYAWKQQRQGLTINGKSDKLNADFEGKFNFSNFQRIITLSAADFPELSSIDLAGSYVALKVFTAALQEDQPPETIFLGQVSSLEKLNITASIPLASSTIAYEIFSATLSLSGSIALNQ